MLCEDIMLQSYIACIFCIICVTGVIVHAVPLSQGVMLYTNTGSLYLLYYTTDKGPMTSVRHMSVPYHVTYTQQAIIATL